MVPPSGRALEVNSANMKMSGAGPKLCTPSNNSLHERGANRLIDHGPPCGRATAHLAAAVGVNAIASSPRLII